MAAVVKKRLGLRSENYKPTDSCIKFYTLARELSVTLKLRQPTDNVKTYEKYQRIKLSLNKITN